MEHSQAIEIGSWQDPEAVRRMFGGEGPPVGGGAPGEHASDDMGEPWLGTLCSDGAVGPARSTNRRGANRPDVEAEGGEDTLDWGWCVRWPEVKLDEWREKFTKAQKAAQGNDVRGALVQIGQVLHLVRPSGGRIGGLYFAWMVEGMGVRLAVMDRTEAFGETPNVRIHVGSLALLRNDLETIYECVRGLVESMGGEIVGEKVSRVDACLDMIDVPVRDFVAPFMTGKVIRRGRNFGVYGSGLEFTGFHVGQEQIRLRVYDKVAECKADPVKWDHMIVHRYGGEVPEVATRVEFQLRRKVLKEFEVETVADWIEKRSGVMDYLTGQWFRLTDEEVDRENTQRFGPSLLWQRVSEGFAKWAGITFRVLERVRLPRRMMDVIGLGRQGIGCFTSAAAIRGKVLETWADVWEFAWKLFDELEPLAAAAVLARFEDKRAACNVALC